MRGCFRNQAYRPPRENPVLPCLHAALHFSAKAPRQLYCLPYSSPSRFSPKHSGTAPAHYTPQLSSKLNSPTDTHICLTLSLCSTQCSSPVSQTTREHLCEASELCSAARAPAPSCTGRYGHDWSAHPPSSDRFCPPYTCTQTISYTLCILGCRGCLPNPSEASKSFNG